MQVNNNIFVETKIKTYNGWVKAEDIVIGDLVLNSDGDYKRVCKIDPPKTTPGYRIKFRTGEIILGPQKLKVFNSYWSINSRVRIRTLEEIKELLNKKHVGLYFKLPNEDSHPGLPVTLPIDPYLLGALYGDGSFRYKPVLMVCADDEIKNEIRKVLPPGHILKPVPMVNRKDIFFKLAKEEGVKENKITTAINELGAHGSYSFNKVLPECYIRASVKDRLSLVQGLMDTDGTSETKGGVSFTTTSLKLSEQFEELIRSLGGDCRTTSRIPSYSYKGIKKKGRVAYTVTIRFQIREKLFRLPRKIIRVLGKSQYSDVLKRRIKSIEKIEDIKCLNIYTEGNHPIVFGDYITLDN